jgi:hypothetical protein
MILEFAGKVNSKAVSLIHEQLPKAVEDKTNEHGNLVVDIAPRSVAVSKLIVIRRPLPEKTALIGKGAGRLCTTCAICRTRFPPL